MRQYKIFTISYCQEENRFLDDEFCEFIQSHVIVEMDKRFFEHPWPCWTVFVCYSTNASVKPVADQATECGNSKDGWIEQLMPEERELAKQIRIWRRRKAAQEKQSDFVYLTNAQIADIARLKPTSLQGLRQISGIGSIKSQKYGQEILAIVRQFLSRPAPPNSEKQAPTPPSQAPEPTEPMPTEASQSQPPMPTKPPQRSAPSPSTS